MADSSMRNIWDILNDVNTEQKLPATTSEHATPKHGCIKPETSQHSVVDSNKETTSDTKECPIFIKSEPDDQIVTNAKPKTSFSLDLIRNRLKFGSRSLTPKDVTINSDQVPKQMGKSTTQNKTRQRRQRRRMGQMKQDVSAVRDLGAGKSVKQTGGPETPIILGEAESPEASFVTKPSDINRNDHVDKEVPRDDKIKADESNVNVQSDSANNSKADPCSCHSDASSTFEDVTNCCDHLKATQQNKPVTAGSNDSGILSIGKSTLCLKLNRCSSGNGNVVNLDSSSTTQDMSLSPRRRKRGADAAQFTSLLEIPGNKQSPDAKAHTSIEQKRELWRIHKREQRERDRKRNHSRSTIDETIDSVLQWSNDNEKTVESNVKSANILDATTEGVFRSSNHVDDVIEYVSKLSTETDTVIESVPKSVNNVDKIIEAVAQGYFSPRASCDDNLDTVNLLPIFHDSSVGNINTADGGHLQSVLRDKDDTLNGNCSVVKTLVVTFLDETSVTTSWSVGERVEISEDPTNRQECPRKGDRQLSYTHKFVTQGEPRNKAGDIINLNAPELTHCSALKTQAVQATNANNALMQTTSCNDDISLDIEKQSPDKDVIIIDSSDQDETESHSMCNCQDSSETEELLEAYGSDLKVEANSENPENIKGTTTMAPPLLVRSDMSDIVPHSECSSNREADVFAPVMTSRESDAQLSSSVHDLTSTRHSTRLPFLRSSHSQPNLNQDIIQLDAPLDLSKKEVNDRKIDLTDVHEYSAKQDDAPLDLSVKKADDHVSFNIYHEFHPVIPSCGDDNERGRNSIFQAFCLANKQSRKISPVRPHIRGKPVISQDGRLIHGSSFQSSISEEDLSGPDYTVFSVKNRIADVVKRKSSTTSFYATPSEKVNNKLSNTFRISGGVISNISSSSTCPITTLTSQQAVLASAVTPANAPVLNVPSYLTNRITSVDRTNPAGLAILTDGNRLYKDIPTAHVKPSTIDEHISEIQTKKLTDTKNVPRQKPKLRRNIPKKAPYVPVSIILTSNEPNGDDVQGMPVLSPHRDTPHDNSRQPKSDCFDVTPPPPSLVRQQPSSPASMNNDAVIEFQSEDELVIQRTKKDRRQSLDHDLNIYDLAAQRRVMIKQSDQNIRSSIHESESATSTNISSFTLSRSFDMPPVPCPSNDSSTSHVNMSAFVPTIGKNADINEKSSLSHHVAFTYETPNEKKYRSDISQTKYYNSLFGGKYTSSLDMHNEFEASIAARSKRNALQSAFPKMQFSSDWKQDLVNYKINHLRIPKQLVCAPRSIPPKFMQGIERFLGADPRKMATKRKANNKDLVPFNLSVSNKKLSPEPEKKKKCKELISILENVKCQERSNTTIIKDSKKTFSRIQTYTVNLVPITKTNAIAALAALITPASVVPRVNIKTETVNNIGNCLEPIESLSPDDNILNIPLKSCLISVDDQQKKNIREEITDSSPDLLCSTPIRKPHQTPTTKVLKRAKASAETSCASASKYVKVSSPDASPIKHFRKSVFYSLPHKPEKDYTQLTPSNDLSTRKSSRSLRSPRRFSEVGWVYPGQDLRKINSLLLTPPSMFDNPTSYCSDPESVSLTSSSSQDSKSSTSFSNSRARNEHDGSLAWCNSAPREHGTSLSSGDSVESPSQTKKVNCESSNLSSHCDSTSYQNESEAARNVRKRKRKTILDQLANTDGYIAEKNLEKTSDSLLIDPSLLSREERALQRAIMKFSEMESRSLANTRAEAEGQIHPSSQSTRPTLEKRKPTPPAQSSSRKKADELKNKAIKGCKATGPDGKPAVIYDKVTFEKQTPLTSQVDSKDETLSAQIARAQLKSPIYKPTICSLSRVDTIPDQPPVSSSLSVCTVSDDNKDEISVPRAKKPRRKGHGWSSCFLFRSRYRGRGRASNSKSTHVKLSSPHHDVRRSLPPSSQDSKRGKVLSAREAIFEQPPRVEIDLAADVSLPSTRLSPGNWSLSPHSSSKSPYTCVLPDSQSSTSRVDDDTMSLCSSTPGDFPRHLIPIEVKRLTACRDTGETILHKAARMDYYDIVLWCCRTNYVEVNARDHAGFSALHETCVSESVEVARCLLEHGADVNVASRLDGVRPLHDAIERDNFELVRLFLAWGADHTLSTYSGKTALKIARTPQMREFLMAYFVDINGSSQMDPETPWVVPFEISVGADTDPAGSDFFVGLPKDDEDSEVSRIVFEESDEPFVPCYLVNLEKFSRPRNCMLLSDLLLRLNLDEDEFRQKHSDLTIHTKNITTIDGPEAYSLLQVCKPSLVILLVEYEEKIKKVLNVESSTLNSIDLAAGSFTKSSTGNTNLAGVRNSSSSVLNCPMIGPDVSSKITGGGVATSETATDSSATMSCYERDEVIESDRSTIPAEDDDDMPDSMSPNDPPSMLLDDVSRGARSRTTTPCFEDQFPYNDCKGCSSPEVDYDDEGDDDVQYQTVSALDMPREQNANSPPGKMMSCLSIPTSQPGMMISLLSGKKILNTAGTTKPLTSMGKMEMHSPSSNGAPLSSYYPQADNLAPQYHEVIVQPTPQPLFIVTSEPRPSVSASGAQGQVLGTHRTFASPRNQSLLYLLTNTDKDNPKSTLVPPLVVSNINNGADLASDDECGLKIDQVCSLSATDARNVFGSDQDMS